MKSNPGKIILFGEYSVLLNNQALAIPFYPFSCRWNDRNDEANHSFTELLAYLKSQADLESYIAINAFETDLAQGLQFESDIPIGMGLGSSGALTASILSRYGQNYHLENHEQVRSILVSIENFFHGNSSGTDPLVSFYQKAIELKNDGTMAFHQMKNVTEGHFFLFNSKLERNTSDLMKYFNEKLESKDFKSAMDNILMPAVSNAIEATLNNDQEAIFSNMHVISAFQLEHFRKMIPEQMVKIWKQGLDYDLFKMKLCGAGGGGYFLGFNKSNENLEWDAVRKINFEN